MSLETAGIHHVTAIASDPQANLEFYAGRLGLRLVKRTVNFDDPGSHHFYYGDESGSPGTLLTFFPWPGAKRGRVGPGQITEVALSIPPGAVGWWEDRLAADGMDFTADTDPDGAARLRFADPDGLPLALVEDAAATTPAWNAGPVPASRAIRGLYGVTLTVSDTGRTARVLAEGLGLRAVAERASLLRHEAAAPAPGRRVDLLAMPGAPAGRLGPGVVHHVAFRAADDARQSDWQQALPRLSLRPTDVMDREYFHSIYFREPGGVLFEIATDLPGFTVDEPLASLGGALRLPAWLEPMRARIESALPEITVPGTARAR